MTGTLKATIKSFLVRILTVKPLSLLGEFFYRGRVTVFFMHRVAIPELGIHGHSTEFLKQALTYLKDNGYTFVSLKDIVEAEGRFARSLPKKAVAFTIDDGFFDQAEIAAPIFIAHDCPVTIFLVSGFLDGQLWPWDDQVAYVFDHTQQPKITISVDGEQHTYVLDSALHKREAISHFQNGCKLLSTAERETAIENLSQVANVTIPQAPPEQYRPLLWQKARELESQNVSFGPHSYSHGIFSRFSAEEAEQEVAEAIKRLNAELSQPLPIFAWPTGRKQDFNEASCRLLAEHGIKAAFSTEPGSLRLEYVQQADRRYLLKRMPLPNELSDLIQYASWMEPFKEHLRAIKRSLKESVLAFLKSGLYRLQSLRGDMSLHRHIDWARVERLVFVCKGNVCRSPYAEFKVLGQGVESISLGIHANRRISANDEAIRQAAVRGVDLMPHITRPLNSVELAAGDLLVCMEPFHAKAMQARASKVGCQMTLLGLWAESNTPIIPDPYGYEPQVFQLCFDSIDNGLKGLLAKWSQSVSDYS